jgi:flagellin
MSNSIQTNVDSIIAQNNLGINDRFKSNTIQQLTSGYRINSSSDDAAGLAVANAYRSQIAQLNQGVLNANDGISSLQIVDGGLSNISHMLDRLQTLATESASDSFSGDRGTLNQEYQTLLGEIDRQANNIGLGSGSTGARYSTNIGVFIGGSAGVQQNAMVNVNLKGAKVDSAGLGIASTNILGGTGTELANSTNLVANSGQILAGGAGTPATQQFTVRTASGSTNVTITGTGAANGLTADQVVNQFNQQLYGTGVSAAIGTDGALQFFSNNGFSIDAAAASSGTGVTSAASTDTINSQNMFNIAQAAVGTAKQGDQIQFTINNNTYNVTYSANDTVAQQVSDINSAMNAYGISAVLDKAGTGFTLQASSAFTVGQGAVHTGTEVITAGTATGPTGTASNITNAQSAISAIASAVTSLGLVQGKVGTGENQLQYAVDLANSQISSFSATESAIRDANIATAAADLAKGQVLQQSSIAALAQANQEPQALLSLLK